MNHSLVINDLSAGYDKLDVLDKLQIGPFFGGQIISVLGPNGAGKSTLLKAIYGLVNATGSVRLGTQELLEQKLEERQKAIAYLPQSLPAGSRLLAYELVLSSVRARRLSVSEADIQYLFQSLGLEPIAFKAVHALSGGMRQLLGLLQVLVHRPKLMLLDEPTSALDLYWQVRMLEWIRDYARSRNAIILASMHDINLAARFSQEMIFLREGRCIQAGPVEQVLHPKVLAQTFSIRANISQKSDAPPQVHVVGIQAKGTL